MGIERLRGAGLAARLVAGTLVLGGVSAGTLVGTDDWWPFAPMNQYAFTVPAQGKIQSRTLEADTVDGTRVKVPLGRSMGLERAELEGQLGRFVEDPRLLQAVAVLYHRRYPDRPPFAHLYLMNRVTTLPERTVTTEVLAEWTVVAPQNPGEQR